MCFTRLIVIVALLASTLRAQPLIRIRGAQPAVPGMINLPYNVPDSSGNQWMIFQGGWLRQQGNQPVYGQAAMLTINGNQPQQNTNQARIDDKTGEVIFDNLNIAGLILTRRVLINRQDSYVRYIDILKNPTQQERAVNLQYNSNFNFGLQGGDNVMDPKHKDQAFAWAGSTGNRAIVEVFAGKGAKVAPTINAQPNNNTVQATMQVTVPAGKQIGIYHIYATAASQDAGAQWATSLKDSQVLKDLPGDVRRCIVNILPSQSIGDREVLRGDLFDIIELRGGDQLKGTLTETSFKLTTFYGPIELPADHVAGLINVGQFKPRQLLVTIDGEVFGGTLAKDSIGIQLSSGQTTQVPLSQIARVGYRKRDGEPEEWAFDKPMVSLRSGERMIVAMPTNEIDVMTRYGQLKLKPDSIAAINFQSENTSVHEIHLTDGSQFAGLVTADKFDMQLTGTTSQQTVSFPTAAISRLQLSNKGDDTNDDDAVLQLSNQDQLVGTIDGQLKLDTMFDTITITGSELRGLSHVAEGGMDVQATLWDQTTLSGQLEQTQVTCNLKSGVTVTVPISLIDHYINPQPKPSQAMIDRIKAVVAQLSADDWKQREQAEAQLVSMGSVVSGVLKDMSASQPPEAQQRIESVLKQVENKKSPSDSPAANGQ